MILRDIPAEFVVDITAIPLNSDKSFPKQGIGRITPKTHRGEYAFCFDNEIVDFRIADENKINNFNLFIQRGCESLSEIIIVNPNKTAAVKTVFFYGGIVALDHIDIGIDDKILETAIRSNKEIANISQLAKLLEDKITIKVGDDTYFVGMFGIATLEDFDMEENNSEEVSIEKFSIYGENVKIPVEKKKLKVPKKVKLADDKEVEIETEEDFFIANKIVFSNHRTVESALRLVKANVIFSDWSKSQTGKLQAIAAGAMKRLCKDESSYLKKWDEYITEEGELLLEKARKVGKIDFSKTEKIGADWRFYIDKDLRDILDENDSIELTDQMPIYLENENLTFLEYLEQFVDSKDKKQIAKILKIKKNYIELDVEKIKIDEPFFLVYSLLGDQVQIGRKLDARKMIKEGRSANPMLGLLIEENGEIPDIQRVTKIKPLSPFVKDKIFKHEPTEMQKKAIEIALNTPDIALIQGPPGTGKTTVITAIIERFNEEFDKIKNVHGEILVSGYQHDAVENIVSRLSVNSLPGVKFGGRSKKEDDEYSGIDDWCGKTAEKIREKNPQIKDSIEQQKLSELFFAYTINPSLKNAQAILNGIIELPRNIISANLVQKARNILEELNPELGEYDPNILKIIYGIRTNEQSFGDDGLQRIENILDNEMLCKKLDINDKKYLVNLLQDAKTIDYNKLKKIRTALLKLFVPRKQYIRSKKKENILEICAETSEYLKKSKSYADKEDEILLNFLMELENNPDKIRETVENHSFVFASTSGQSVGRSITKKKESFLDNPEMERVKYDTVIIDEAARVSPLDLLIPMALGEKRIILVGDHRQLPHIVDEEIAKKLESAEGSVNNDYIKDSMFQYLFRRLKALEQKDGICRTVTLDSQYRMHPLLGKFISENFYKIHNEDFRSPLDEKYFVQSLPKIENKPAVWVDIPNVKGKEERDNNNSRFRTAEIQAIAKYLREWKNCDAGKDLSFGVISFYKAQVDKIKDELKNYGITENEKLKIGTVDSFQGMEFDVVFLSAVRTEETRKFENTDFKSDTEKQKRMQRLFGFLMSKNRLCVSMSRQKRVLVVVGDKDLFVSEIGKEAMPELSNYYELCKTKGVVL